MNCTPATCASTFRNQPPGSRRNTTDVLVKTGIMDTIKTRSWYELAETQQRLRTDCRKRVLLIVAKHAGTSDRVLPLSGSDACCSPG